MMVVLKMSLKGDSMNWIKRLFCKHTYEKVGWFWKTDLVHNTTYSERIHRCTKCGKEIFVDGRYDTTNR